MNETTLRWLSLSKPPVKRSPAPVKTSSRRSSSGDAPPSRIETTASVRSTLDNRYLVAISLSAVSNSALANKATAIVSLIVSPILEVLLLVAMLTSVGVYDVRDTAYASIVLAFGISVLNGTVMQAEGDRARGILQEVVGHGIWNPPYWVGKLSVPMILGILPAILSALAVFLVNGASDVDMFIKVLWSIPLAALVGALVGITASLASFALPDPFLVSNIAGTILLITAGVVLPLGMYPTWLAWIARFLPFTATIEAVRTEGNVWPFILRELLVALMWFAVGLAIARRVLTRLRSGHQPQGIW